MKTLIISINEQLKLLDSLSTLEDFQIFINNYNISSLTILERDFNPIFNRIIELKLITKIEFKANFVRLGNFNSIEKIQNFLTENKVDSAKEFQRKFSGLYKVVIRLGVKPYLNLIDHRKQPKGLTKRFKTEEDLNNYIISNKIENRSQLLSTEEGKSIYRLKKKKKWNITYYTVNQSHLYNTKEKIQKFIFDNKITSKRMLYTKFKDIKDMAKKLKVLNELKYFDETAYITLEEANKFIKENDIKSLNELNKKYHDKYRLFKNFYDKLVFPKDEKPIINSIDDLKTLINDNNIQSRRQLYRKFPSAYREYLKHYQGQVSFEKDKLSFKYRIRERFKSVEDINNYLLANNIDTYSQLVSTEEGRGIHNYANYNNWKISYKIHPADFSEYNTKEDFQNYIDSNGILSAIDFLNINPGLYSRACNLKVYSELKYKYRKRSSLEIKINKKLKELDIEFEEEKTFKDLRDKNPLRFDFYIKSKRIAIEPGGIQHLLDVDFFGRGERFEILTSHDRAKREYCLKNNITLLYYFEKGHYIISEEEFSKLVSEYPGECYTVETFDDLFKRILSIESSNILTENDEILNNEQFTLF